LLLQQLDVTHQLLLRLGWLVNLEKSDLIPSKRLQFIGGLFDTQKALLLVPEERFHLLLPLVKAAFVRPLFLREWQRLLGLLTSCQDLTVRGRLHLRPLQRFLYPWILRDLTSQSIQCPADLLPHLQWWTNPSNVFVGTSLIEFQPVYHLFVDASLQGWGAHLGFRTAADVWSDRERELHVNSLEFLAVINAISPIPNTSLST